jgi:hypothetical protein
MNHPDLMAGSALMAELPEDCQNLAQAQRKKGKGKKARCCPQRRKGQYPTRSGLAAAAAAAAVVVVVVVVVAGVGVAAGVVGATGARSRSLRGARGGPRAVPSGPPPLPGYVACLARPIQ